MFVYFLPQIENAVKMDNLVNALTYFFHQLLLGGGGGRWGAVPSTYSTGMLISIHLN